MTNYLARKILSPLPTLVRWYLSRKRAYRYHDINVDILPGVFHPGLFFSTNLLLNFMTRQSLQGASVLEVGAGSGILSIQANRMGALVTAIDISPLAIKNIAINAAKNNAAITIVQSDLFSNLTRFVFDWIFVNPPYFPKAVVREEDFAWNCGENHEYFAVFFSSLNFVSNENTKIIMVLSEVCDLDKIFKIASLHNFKMEKLVEKKIWLDGKNYIFQIKPNR